MQRKLHKNTQDCVLVATKIAGLELESPGQESHDVIIEPKKKIQSKNIVL